MLLRWFDQRDKRHRVDLGHYERHHCDFLLIIVTMYRVKIPTKHETFEANSPYL